MILPRFSYQTRLKLILLPFIGGVFLLVILPALLSFGLAFFQYDTLSPPRWVGGLNFVLVYTDELFNLSIRNSLALIVLPVPLRVLGGLLLARLLQYRGRFLNGFRAMVFLPSVVPAAAFALAGLWLFNPLFGPVNLLIRGLGFNPPAWFVDPGWAKPGLVLLSLWGIGEGFLVSLAALQDIPVELEEAARIDGAGVFQFFIRVTLPLIAPILLLLGFRDAILTFQNTYIAINFTTGGGPYYATFTLPMFIHEQGFDRLFLGTASAGLWVLYGLTGLVVFGIYLVGRSWQVGTTDDAIGL